MSAIPEAPVDAPGRTPGPGAGERCPACGREAAMPCRSTRDMEDRPEPACRAILMMLGGGEYTANRMACGRWHATLLFAAFRAGLADPAGTDEAGALREMAGHGLVAGGRNGPWTDATPEGEAAAIAAGLTGAGLATRGADGLLATPRGRDVVLGRASPWGR